MRLRQLEPEGDRLGVDAVAAADGRGELMLEGAAFQHLQQLVHVGDQDVGGALQLHGEAGVEYVARRHALVQEAGFRPGALRDVSQEGDDVVLGLGLDRVDALDVERARLGIGLPHGAGGFPGDDAQVGHRIEGMRLDLEPDAETAFGGPDRDHIGTRVARDHHGILRVTTGKDSRLAEVARGGNKTARGRRGAEDAQIARRFIGQQA